MGRALALASRGRNGRSTPSVPEQLRRRRCLPRVFLHAVGAALITLLHLAVAHLPRELADERVGAVLRRPAEPLASVVPPPGHAAIGRRAPNHGVADMAGQ